MAGQLAIEAAHERWRLQWGQMRHTVDLLARYLYRPRQDLARQLGVSRQAVYTWLGGERVPEMAVVEGIAVVLGVPRHVLDLSPQEAIRWCLDHPDDLNSGR